MIGFCSRLSTAQDTKRDSDACTVRHHIHDPRLYILSPLPCYAHVSAVHDGTQVQKLSDGDAEETTRSLYNRNVSSSKLLDEKNSEPLPEPKRMAGNIISFRRSVHANLTVLPLVFSRALTSSPDTHGQERHAH